VILFSIFFVLLGFWIFLVLLNWVARLWLTRKMKQWREQVSQPRPEPDSPSVPNAQELLPCHQCGTFIAPETAIRKKGYLYCCKEHVND
jgi:hypothetical protein